jgi:uncharacterized membrane protein YphA (DoxX/SURF4 family)
MESRRMMSLRTLPITVLRVAFGALFAFSGANDLLHFWQPPVPTTTASQAFIGGLAASGFILPVLGVVFLLAGVALILNRCSAAALVALAAPVVAIFGYHAFAEGHVFSIGTIVLAAYLLLIWDSRTQWRGLFATRAPVDGLSRVD